MHAGVGDMAGESSSAGPTKREASNPERRTWHAFFTQNEIFFKTATATFLSLMALIVSFAQLYTAQSQYGIAQFQAKIAESNALPIFDISLDPKLNMETGKFDQIEMVIQNTGGAVSEFQAEPMFFLKVDATLDKVGAPVRFVSFAMPADGFFTSQSVSAVSKGKLTTITDYQNNAKFGALLERVRKETPSTNWSSLVVTYDAYVHLHYRDLLDRQHDDYYQVPWVGAGSRVSDETARTMFSLWNKQPRPELSTSMPAELFAEATRRIEAGSKSSP
jgi:hypothetical protein